MSAALDKTNGDTENYTKWQRKYFDRMTPDELMEKRRPILEGASFPRQKGEDVDGRRVMNT